MGKNGGGAYLLSKGGNELIQQNSVASKEVRPLEDRCF